MCQLSFRFFLDHNTLPSNRRIQGQPGGFKNHFFLLTLAEKEIG
jgi:hypothetical protein